MSQAFYRIMNVVGARPNMMKVAPLVAEMRHHPELQPVIVHTGQHYDYSMSQVFFEQLNIPEPDYNLEVGSATHHAQTAEIIKRFGELVQQDRPDMVLVVGDVNSTIACALVGAKESIPVAHVEAGLRSFDRGMPEEINRVLTDSIADLLFTTEESGNQNLANEGVGPDKVFFVGNLMIDSLVGAIEAARRSRLVSKLGLQKRGYGVVTLHRPSNVDDSAQLTATLAALAEVARGIPIIFPVHPRTRQKILASGFFATRSWDGETPITSNGMWMMPPASYLDFLGLVDSAAMVITDSGGIQEETTYLGVPCLTYRNNTERPVTVTMGTNRLIGTEPAAILRHTEEILSGSPSRNGFGHKPPPLWDGHAAPRIVRALKEYLSSKKASPSMIVHA
ncbi:MAG: UDP-N-acetylglucosamine 2-epimerase (non-hydrolyzing) [Candidatus Korobacteraceae bacterium]